MLVKRYWVAKQRGKGLFSDRHEARFYAEFVGWFLFGFIPLYVKQVSDWHI